MTATPTLLNGTIITPHRTLQDGSIQWGEDGIITHMDDQPAPGQGVFVERRLLICPGFINLHVHGGMGVDTLDATLDAFATLSRDQARQGVTSFLPTTASAAQETLIKVCETMRQFKKQCFLASRSSKKPEALPFQGAEILGLHIEGPYISPEKAGAQNPAHFRDPSWDEFCAWQAVSGNAVRLLALAPERDPDGSFIKRVAAAGVIISAAHTNASYEIAQTAIRHGLSHGTHVFNAMSRLDYRAPRVLEALLGDDRVMLELIPDCTDIPHIHPVAIGLLKRMVGIDRICAITDAISAAGMRDGVYTLGGLAVRKDGNVAFLEEPWATRGERKLAGSVLEMNVGVWNLIHKAGYSITEAVQTASTNPARVLGLEAVKGSLEVGKYADIVVLSPDTFEVVATFVQGQKVFGNA